MLLAFGVAISATTLARAEAPYLTLIETIVDPNVWPPGERTIADGEVTITLYGGAYKVQHTWSRPPAMFDASGFEITLGAAGQVTSECSPLYGGTGIAGSSFTFSADPPGTDVNLVPPANCRQTTGASGADTATIRVTPQPYLRDESIVELKLHAYYGPGVAYRYLVSNAQPAGWTGPPGPPGPPTPPGPVDDGTLAGTLECDSDTIVISALPSLNCHIVLTSWRRNTADPVEVSFPGELDTFGNHPNGIQLSGRGSEDVFNWDAPRRWGLFVFACPGQQGAGVNCLSAVTVPGMTATEILVRQGEQTLRLTLTLNAVAHPSTMACGYALGSGIMAKWRQTGAESGVLGCARSDEAEAGASPQGTSGRYALFEHGVVVWHANGPFARSAFEVHGCIASVYQGMNGTNSWLGFPTSDEYDIRGGRRSDFEGGYIVWNALTGVCNAHVDGSSLFAIEPGVDRPGLDYRSFVPAADSLDLCRDACAAESACVAFTWVKPGLQGPTAQCWLKSAVPSAGASDCCTSGVRR